MLKKSARHSNAYGLALFLGALIILLVVVALAIKAVLLFTHSSFDGKHQFSVEIKESGETRFYVFNPADSSIHTLLIHGNISDNPEFSLGIPVDALAKSKEDIQSSSGFANKLIFNEKALQTTTNIIDGINLFIFTHTANSDDAIFKEINISSDPSKQDSVFTQIFTDKAIYKEGKSIAIVNGTGISGLGTEVARLLTHMGANVVSVTTADTNINSSTLQYAGNTSYTLDRLSRLFHLQPTHLSGASISDITLILGQNFREKSD